MIPAVRNRGFGSYAGPGLMPDSALCRDRALCRTGTYAGPLSGPLLFEPLFKY